MVKHVYLGSSKAVPKHLLSQLMHSQKPFSHSISGYGYAGGMKKDIGSMRSINGSGQGVKSKKLTPLRFKM